MRITRLALLVVLAACARTSPTSTVPTPPENDPTEATVVDVSAVEFVRGLEAEVRSGRSSRADDAVDEAFAARLPSGEPLTSLFGTPPPDCAPSYEEGPGYGAIAIPPPMNDDSPAESARIQGIIDELQASTEVMVLCSTPGEDEASVMPLYAIALRRGEIGGWTILAWRDFRREDPSR